MLLSLPEKLDQFNKNKNKKGKKRNKTFEQRGEEKELDTNEVHTLKQTLIRKLVNFAEKKSFVVLFEDTLIQDFKCENQKIKCKIECPMCGVQQGCDFNQYWNVSNFERHLKKHFRTDTDSEYVNVETDQIISHNNEYLDDILSD